MGASAPSPPNLETTRSALCCTKRWTQVTSRACSSGTPNPLLPASATEGAVRIWPSLLPPLCSYPSVTLSSGMPRDAVLPLRHGGLS